METRDMSHGIEITIRRTDGTVEIKIKEDWMAGFVRANWGKIIEATEAAGKGTPLSWRDLTPALTDAERERNEIARRLDRAEAAKDHDYAAYCAAVSAHERELAAWREAHPAAAAAEDAAGLRRRAAHERDLADGALLYDCDGSLGEAAREERAAEFAARADEYERRADAITG